MCMSKMPFATSVQVSAADVLAKLLSHQLAGEYLDDGETKTGLILCNDGPQPGTFLLWTNADTDDSELFQITVTKCPDA
jgi:hypothetical protein